MLGKACVVVVRRCVRVDVRSCVGCGICGDVSDSLRLHSRGRTMGMSRAMLVAFCNFSDAKALTICCGYVFNSIQHLFKYNVNILDAPEIEVEVPFVHTGVGYDTQLVCLVHAEPTPQVVWYKHNTQLGITEQLSQQV